MHQVFQRFIDLLSGAEDPDAFSDAMAVTAAALDLSCFAYLAMPSQSSKQPLVISTYPVNWITQYVRNHYERLDPVVMQALQATDPFRWGLGVSATHTSAQNELFEEASQFGIRLGFTVPIHDGRGPVAALTFAADQKRQEFEKCIGAHARVLQLMAMYFHAHVRRKLAREVTKVGGILLSPRELECLEWASQGKSAWDTGHILGISRNTVADYLENAKKKLGVRTVVQAAAMLAVAKK